MSENKDVNEVLGNKKKDTKVEVNVNELAELFKAISSQQDEKLAKALDTFSQAFLDSRKPYKDPRQEENDATMRKSMKELRERQIAQMKADQAYCQHLQGSNALSKLPGQLTCIVRHITDTGEVIGLCTNCGRCWREGDEDYAIWMRKASGNEISSAGRRSFLDPTSVKRAGR